MIGDEADVAKWTSWKGWCFDSGVQSSSDASLASEQEMPEESEPERAGID
jgi:hypothetical protein